MSTIASREHVDEQRPIGIVFLSESDDLPKQSYLIQWTDSQNFSSGRLTDIDDSKHVKSIVASRGRSPIVDIAERQGIVVIADTNVRIVKAAWKRNQGYSRVPDWILRLMDMLDLSVHPERPTLRTLAHKPVCSVCHDEFTRLAQPERAVYCSLCLMAFHARCCETDVLPLIQIEFAKARSLTSSSSSSSSANQSAYLPSIPSNFQLPEQVDVRRGCL
jgi:hypothetical protein